MVISEDTSQQAVVSGFLKDLGQIEAPIASVAVAYDDEISYVTYLLVFHQVLYFPDMEYHLLSPMQLEMNDLIVNDKPLISLLRSRSMGEIKLTDHSIISKHPPLHIPLSLRGTMSRFKCRPATMHEYENPQDYPQIVMSYATPSWDPYCESFSQMEENLRGKVGYSDTNALISQYNISTVDLVMSSISNVYTRCLHSLVSKTIKVSSTNSVRKKGTVTPEVLAKRWRIGVDLAKRTIDRTTQLGVRDFTAIQGSRRLRHSNQQFNYRRFNATVYTDTMLPMIPTLQRNTCAQVYSTSFQWIKSISDTIEGGCAIDT